MLLLTIASGWWLKADCQSVSGTEMYYYMSNRSLSISSQLWYESAKGWYTEARYNYEAAKTISLYSGKTFGNESAFSYTVTPLAGVVAGQYNGGALACNGTVDYTKWSFSLQSQYTFSIQDKMENFIYSWAEIGYQVSGGFAAGVSLQQTKLYQAKSTTAQGLFIRGQYGRWQLPLYLFNIQQNDRQIVLGLTYTSW